jgi:hypothetical protein
MHGVQRVSQDQSPARAPKDKRRRALWFEYLKPIPLYWSLALGVAVWVIFFGLWELATAKGWSTPCSCRRRIMFSPRSTP